MVSYLTMFVVLLVVIWLLIHGGVWLGQRITPYLFTASAYVLAFTVLGFVPLCFTKETRVTGGSGMVIASFVFGITLWFWSLLLTYQTWGWLAVIIGLVIMGIGVFPIALIAMAIHGEWKIFAELILIAVLTFGFRGAGSYVTAQYQSDPGEPETMPTKLIVSTWLLFACSFMPKISYVTALPLLVCAIVLLFSKNKRARKHGIAAGSMLVALLALAFTVGWASSDLLLR